MHQMFQAKWQSGLVYHEIVDSDKYKYNFIDSIH